MVGFGDQLIALVFRYDIRDPESQSDTPVLLKIAPDLYDITVFGAEPHPNYNRILLSPVLAGEQTVDQIILNPLAWYEQQRITLHRGKKVVRLDRATGTLSIDRVEPRVRVEPLAKEAIPTIPLKVIEPFLARPLVIEHGGLDAAPQIVATQEGRYNIGAGSRAYVAGIGSAKENLWQVYRQGIALVDPDTNTALGYEAIYLGAARLLRVGDPSTISIVSAVQEIS